MLILIDGKIIGSQELCIYDKDWMDKRITIDGNCNELVKSVTINIKELKETDINNAYIEIYVLFTPRTTWDATNERWGLKKIYFDKDIVASLRNKVI